MSETLDLFTAVNEADVNFCLNRGDDINQKLEKFTPYSYHCMNNNIEVVIALVKNGCDINHMRKFGKWPKYDIRFTLTGLDSVCFHGYTSLLVELLKFEHVKNSINNQEILSSSPFYYKYDNHDKILSPLMWCCAKGNTDIFDILIEHGADINYRSDIERSTDYAFSDRVVLTPLMIACHVNEIYIVNRLLQLNVNLEIEDICGQTAIFHCRTSDILIQLLLHGANVNHIDYSRHSFLGILIDQKYQKQGNVINRVVSILLRFGADPNVGGRKLPINISISNKDYNLTKLLLENGAHPNVDYIYEHPLRTAIRVNNIRIVKLLLDFGANPNLVYHDSNKSLISYARDLGHNKMVLFLEKSGFV